MKELITDRFLIAAPQGVAGKLCAILGSAGIEPEAVFDTGAQALQAAGTDSVLLLTTWKLADMTGAELAERLGEASDVMMIVPQSEEDLHCGENTLLLRNPISQDALIQAVRTMRHSHLRMNQLRRKAEKLARTLEERKVVDRAKGKLMDTLHITESEAHYRIQKKSMDSGRRIVDVAREILEAGSAAVG